MTFSLCVDSCNLALHSILVSRYPLNIKNCCIMDTLFVGCQLYGPASIFLFTLRDVLDKARK